MTTPDEHIKTLDELAGSLENRGRSREYRSNPAMIALLAKRAAAIRWILNETAYPVVPEMAESRVLPSH